MMAKKKSLDIIDGQDDTAEAGASGPLTVGDYLKDARLKRKAEIDKIAKALCIRAPYLRALEEGKYDIFPGQIYAVGFLKNYAEYLHLNVNELLDLYHQETSFIHPPKQAPMPIQERPSLMPTFNYLISGVLLIALAAGVWYFATYPEESREPTLPPIANEEIATEKVADVVEQPIAVANPLPNTHARVQIKADKDVWLEIQDEDTFIFNRTLKKGETFDVPNNGEGVTLKTGDAGAVTIYVDGEKVKSIGANGVVRSGVSLAADALKNR